MDAFLSFPVGPQSRPPVSKLESISGSDGVDVYRCCASHSSGFLVNYSSRKEGRKEVRSSEVQMTMEDLARGPKGAVEWIGGRWNEAVNVNIISSTLFFLSLSGSFLGRGCLCYGDLPCRINRNRK